MAFADFYLKSGQTEKARELAINMSRQFPDHNAAMELLRYFER